MCPRHFCPPGSCHQGMWPSPMATHASKGHSSGYLLSSTDLLKPTVVVFFRNQWHQVPWHQQGALSTRSDAQHQETWQGSSHAWSTMHTLSEKMQTFDGMLCSSVNNFLPCSTCLTFAFPMRSCQCLLTYKVRSRPQMPWSMTLWCTAVSADCFEIVFVGWPQLSLQCGHEDVWAHHCWAWTLLLLQSILLTPSWASS